MTGVVSGPTADVVVAATSPSSPQEGTTPAVNTAMVGTRIERCRMAAACPDRPVWNLNPETTRVSTGQSSLTDSTRNSTSLGPRPGLCTGYRKSSRQGSGAPHSRRQFMRSRSGTPSYEDTTRRRELPGPASP